MGTGSLEPEDQHEDRRSAAQDTVSPTRGQNLNDDLEAGDARR